MAGCLLVLTACELLHISKEGQRLDNLSSLQGIVTSNAQETGQLYTLLLKYSEGMPTIVNKIRVDNDGRYRFYAESGVYAVGAFLDVNGDGQYQNSEPANYLKFPDASPILYKLDSKTFQKLPDLVVETAINRRSKEKLKLKLSNSINNIGKVTGLDNPLFTPKNAKMGLWRPLEFLDQYGAGMYLLQPYQQDKTPVLYIHGMTGSPTEFSHLIDSLDRERFQPWIINYPSGVPLEILSDYVLYGLNQLHANYGFNEVYIIAHSMGGLMVRSFVGKHQQTERPYNLGMVMTINSPMLGLPSAAKGVKTSPIVLPVWRDVATDSDYIRSVHGWIWPDSIPYHLVFSYKDGKDGDGVVPMGSQLSRSLQREATGIHGFNEDHVSVLKSNEFIDLLGQIMRQPSAQKPCCGL